MLYSVQPIYKVTFVRGGVPVYEKTVVSGCHQGGPVSTFHFAIGIRPLCSELQKVVPEHKAMCGWIHDDFSVAGSLSGCFAATSVLLMHCEDYGLRLKGSPDPRPVQLELSSEPCH